MAELKPCPFCGWEVYITQKRAYKAAFGNCGGCVKIRCKHCETEMWEHSKNEENYETIVKRLAEKWNRRISNG